MGEIFTKVPLKYYFDTLILPATLESLTAGINMIFLMCIECSGPCDPCGV